MLKEARVFDIVKLIKDKELVIFTGAGVSTAAPSSLYGFLNLQNELIWSLCEGLEGVGKEYEYTYYEIKKGKHSQVITEKFVNLMPEYVFQVCENEMGEYALNALEIFKLGLPNHNHVFLAKALAKRIVPAVFTTNFDCLLEETKEQIGEEAANENLRINRRPKDFVLTDDKIQIYKLHGSIDDKHSIVVTLNQIGKRYVSPKTKILRHFLENYHVLFTGYKGSDLDIFACLVTSNCRGIIWNARSINSIPLKIKRLLQAQNGRLLLMDLNELFCSLGEALGFGNIRNGRDNIAAPRINITEKLGNWSIGIENHIKYAILGDIWEYILEWGKAILFYQKGLELARNQRLYMAELLYLGRLANLYYKQSNFEKAESLCEQKLKINEKLNSALRLYNLVITIQVMGLIHIGKEEESDVL